MEVFTHCIERCIIKASTIDEKHLYRCMEIIIIYFEKLHTVRFASESGTSPMGISITQFTPDGTRMGVAICRRQTPFCSVKMIVLKLIVIQCQPSRSEIQYDFKILEE